MSEKNIDNNNSKKNNGIIEMFKNIEKEDKIILLAVAAILIIILGAWAGGRIISKFEDRHQAQLRIEANVPECEHIKEAQAQLYKTKEQFRAKITSGFDEYWDTFEKNFWVEFRNSHIKNYPDCFAAQNGK